MNYEELTQKELELYRAKKKDTELRGKVIIVFDCQDCVALEECITDKPMNFCIDKRNWLKGSLALVERQVAEAVEQAKREERERIHSCTYPFCEVRRDLENEESLKGK